MEFDAYVYDRLPKIKNREDIFGKQEIYNGQDEKCGTIEKLLINACDISFDDLWPLVAEFDGVMFPAHIDKNANSLINNLGFVPPDSLFKTAELHDLKMLHSLRKANPYLEHCRVISNSDAHYLPDIREPGLTIQVKERNIKSVIEYIRNA